MQQNAGTTEAVQCSECQAASEVRYNGLSYCRAHYSARSDADARGLLDFLRTVQRLSLAGPTLAGGR
jgi:hypothetical protein